MRITINKIFLIFIVLKQVYAAEGEEIFFVKIVNNIPYVVINNPNNIIKLQNRLIESGYGYNYRDNLSKIYVDTSQVITINNMNLYYGGGKINCYCIKGSDNSLESATGFKPGEKLLIQKPDKNGDIFQTDITIRRILIHIHKEQFFIIIECNHIELPPFWFSQDYAINIFIATYYKNWINNIPKNTISNNVPLNISMKVDSLAEVLIPPRFQNALNKYEWATVDTSVSINEVRFIDDENIISIYCCVVSYFFGKDMCGYLFLFNKKGNIIQINEGDYYNRIIGITDVNRDGSHELIVVYGSSYGGGIKVLSFDKNKYYFTNKPFLYVNSEIATMFD